MGTTHFPKLELTRPPTVTANKEALDSTQLQPGFKLPQSYRHFAMELGYGLLCRLLIIYIPMEGEDSLLRRNAVLRHTIQQGIEEELFEYEPDGSPELAKRLVPFGISENGHILAWDPKDRSGPDEHRIYVLGSKLLAVRRAAKDLYEFVEECLDSRVKGMLGSGYSPLPAVFEPFVVKAAKVAGPSRRKSAGRGRTR